MEPANKGQAVAHDRNAFHRGIAASHSKAGTDIQRERQEPRTNRPKHGGGFIEQALGGGGVAGRKVERRDPRSTNSRSPLECQRPKPFKTPGVVLAGRVQMAEGVFHAPQQVLSLRYHRHLAGIGGQCEGPRQGRACVRDLSLRVS